MLPSALLLVAVALSAVLPLSASAAPPVALARLLGALPLPHPAAPAALVVAPVARQRGAACPRALCDPPQLRRVLRCACRAARARVLRQSRRQRTATLNLCARRLRGGVIRDAFRADCVAIGALRRPDPLRRIRVSVLRGLIASTTRRCRTC